MENRPSKKTNTPASDRQKAIIGRLILRLLRYGEWETKEEVQEIFFERTGYRSVKEISRYQFNILVWEYLDLLRAAKADRMQWRRLSRVYY
jgi:hypothetical protein